MPLHKNTFEYLMPTDQQKADMHACRAACGQFMAVLDQRVPEGPDKTYLMRKLREVSMWANIAITRHADGAPRT